MRDETNLPAYSASIYCTVVHSVCSPSTGKRIVEAESKEVKSESPIDNHPRLKDRVLAYKCKRRVPRQKFSIKLCSSGGLRLSSIVIVFQFVHLGKKELEISTERGYRREDEPKGSPSHTITSVSTLQCTNQESLDLLTVPLIPIKQCSNVGVNNSFVVELVEGCRWREGEDQSEKDGTVDEQRNSRHLCSFSARRYLHIYYISSRLPSVFDECVLKSADERSVPISPGTNQFSPLLQSDAASFFFDPAPDPKPHESGCSCYPSQIKRH